MVGGVEGEDATGGGVFGDAFVGYVAGEESRVVGDFDLLVQGVGDIAVDGGEAAGEGDGAVVGKACAAGAKGSEAGDLAGIVKREIVVVEGSAGEVDQAGVGIEAEAEEDFIASGGDDSAGIIDGGAQEESSADGFDGAAAVDGIADGAVALNGAGAGDFSADEAGGSVFELDDAAVGESERDIGGAGSEQEQSAVVVEAVEDRAAAGDGAADG